MNEKLELVREQKLYKLRPGKKKSRQPETCANKNQSIHVFRIPGS